MRNDFNTFIGLTKRNILVFMREKAAVFFSLLAPIIVLTLYILFLKDAYTDTINSILSELGSSVSSKKVDNLVNAWLLSGFLGTSCITIPLSSLYVIVSDKETLKDYDFNSAPTKKWVIFLSYLMGSFVSTLIIGFIILTLGIIFLLITGLSLSIGTILILYLLLTLGAFSGASFMMLVVSFFRKTTALNSFTGIVCAAVGFLIGAYMPISQFPDWIQTLANLFPGSHITALFRNYLMSDITKDISIILNIPTFFDEMSTMFGFELKVFNNDVNKFGMYLYALLSTVVIVAAETVVFIKKSKRK